MKSILALTSVTLIGACAVTVPSYVPTAALSIPISEVETGVEKTAKVGDFLLIQEFAELELYSLDQEVIVPPFSSYNRQYNVPKGSLLQEGFISTAEGSGEAFCTIEITSSHTDIFKSSIFNTKSCFLDADLDGKFEWIYQTSVVSDYVFDKEEYSPEKLALQEQTPIGPHRLSAPITVSDSDRLLKASSSLALKFEDNSISAIQIDRKDKSFQSDLKDGMVRIPRTLPATLDILDARVTIISSDSDTITYRVESAFASDISRYVALR